MGIHAPEFFSVTVYDKYIMKATGTVYADPYDGEYAFCQKLFQRFSGDAVCALPYGCDVQGVFQRLPLDIAFIIIHLLLDKTYLRRPDRYCPRRLLLFQA